MPNLLDSFPPPLLEAIVSGRWLPVVGAGLSRNAIVPSGDSPPDWVGLARLLEPELPGYEATPDPVETVSTYAHDHGRAALVERVGRHIRIADALPAPVHLSLCRLPIDQMITSNFDFLLEKAFDSIAKPCHPVVDEAQLSITNPYPGPVLYKMHGDMHRPDRLVLTEEDYDRYLMVNPLYSTVMASLFAQRSAVLIGYSLGDPDLRQILSLVRERLGRGARTMYTLAVDAPAAAVQRFERRGVKVISLPGSRSNPAPALEELFDEIFERIPREVRQTLMPRDYDSAVALRRSGEGRAVFLSAPLSRQPDYLEWLVPAAERLGISLVRLEDFVAPGASVMSTLEAVVATASAAVVDVDSEWTQFELGLVLARLGPDRVAVVSSSDRRWPAHTSPLRRFALPELDEHWPLLADHLLDWLATTLDVVVDLETGPSYEMVGQVIHLASQLELFLGDRLAEPPRRRTLGRLVERAIDKGLVDDAEGQALRSFVVLRNEVAHGRAPSVGWDGAALMQADIERIIERLGEP